ncbi:hypothetical protein [Synechocystis sp. LKSZ1]|uniref:hypothetical protein n=1 Tax=Synechocystis sp. LKSZ1 TaxID=3144951 RepID=UPI00336BFD6E
MAHLELKAPNRNGRVTIIVNAKMKQEGRLIAASPVTERMVSALKQAIMAHSPHTIIETIAAASLWSEGAQRHTNLAGRIYCPLTIQLPQWLTFPAQAMYQACQDIQGRRQWVHQHLHIPVNADPQGLGDCWLPIIWTAQGALYGAIIGEGMMPNAYQQPLSLTTSQYQQLQHLGQHLLEDLAAPPSVYLLQFSLLNQEIIFDRLWPFPAAPALASLGTSTPDLFTYHWYCLNNLSLAAIQGLTPQNALT